MSHWEHAFSWNTSSYLEQHCLSMFITHCTKTCSDQPCPRWTGVDPCGFDRKYCSIDFWTISDYQHKALKKQAVHCLVCNVKSTALAYLAVVIHRWHRRNGHSCFFCSCFKVNISGKSVNCVKVLPHVTGSKHQICSKSSRNHFKPPLSKAYPIKKMVSCFKSNQLTSDITDPRRDDDCF